MGTYSEYLRILNKEMELKQEMGLPSAQNVFLSNPARFANFARRILEVAKNGTILRCCGPMGHLTNDAIAYESDGAHANLVREIADCALDSLYGWGENTPIYTRYEIEKAALWHDLPENETGDSPDNGTRNEAAKATEEQNYFNDYANLHSAEESISCFYIVRLLDEMRGKSTEEGRILYLADKLAAIITVLAYDDLGLYPHAYPDDPDISEINLAEMKICQAQENGSYLLSELWTNDFLFVRELTRYDDSGFFTALLVMATLLVHGQWYPWREAHYLT